VNFCTPHEVKPTLLLTWLKSPSATAPPSARPLMPLPRRRGHEAFATQRRAASSCPLPLTVPPPLSPLPTRSPHLPHRPLQPIYADKVVDQLIIPGADGEYGVTAGISPIISELIPGLVCLPCLRRAPTPTPSPYSLGYDPGCVHMYMCTHTPTASIDLTSYASLTSPKLSNPHSPPPPSSSHDPHPRSHLGTAGDGDA
jgi:hypothetical protein